MRGRMECEREGCLLDEDDYSSTNSDPGKCRWMFLIGVFLSQLVFSGMLASYGVLLVQLVDEKGLSPRTAFWIPVIYTVTWCFLDPLWKKMTTGENKDRSRLFAVIGVLTTASGVAASSLTYIPSLQMLLYGLIGGVGTSMVLMQTDVALCCHYPMHVKSSVLAHCVPQLGKAVAQFAMPLLLLGFTSSYGLNSAPLLQAGLILHGLLGAITYVPPQSKPVAESRFISRPRAFTFIDTERQSIINRDNYINSSYSECSWKNPSSHTEGSDETSNLPETIQSNIRCNKNQNGVDILPEIPEESEIDDESNYSSIMDFEGEKQNNHFPVATLSHGAKSLGDIMSDSPVESDMSKRWSIGIADEVVPIHVENGLAQIAGLVKNVIDQSDSQKMDDSKDASIVTLDEVRIDSSSDDLPGSGMLSSTKSLDFTKLNIHEKQKKLEIDCVKNDGKYRKVKSLDNVVSVLVHSQENRINGNNYKTENFSALDPLDMTAGANEQNKRFLTDREACDQIALLDQTSPGRERQRWSIGSVDEIFSISSKLNGNIPSNSQDVNSRKWHSAELPRSAFPFELTENNISQEVDEVECSSPVSTGSDRPLWPKRNPNETFHIQGTNESNKLTLSQVLRILRNSFSCQYYHRRTFRRRYNLNPFSSCLWSYLDPVTTPYFFPSLLLRFTLRFCPMGFAALTPRLAMCVIEDVTLREAVFSVSVAGFVWLCYLLVTPWCTNLRPMSRKYLFATGNLVAAFALHFLSKAESHDRVTLGCAVFGLGQGITMATGMTVMRDSLGSWNLTKVDTILDIASGFLILLTAAIMGLILKDKDKTSLTGCFMVMAVIYLVTGVTWLLRPLINNIQCQHNTQSDWSTSGHLLSSG